MLKTFTTVLFLFLTTTAALAQSTDNLFQPFISEWPSPNECRLGSGAPGPGYWQQQADYKIKVTLDPEARTITGSETVTYTNHSPHTLDYLWLQLDQNIRKHQSVGRQLNPVFPMTEQADLANAGTRNQPFEGGYTLQKVADAGGKALDHYVGETNLRINLQEALKPGASFSFQVEWSYPINDATLEGRSGFEYFLEDGNNVFEIAQFYPRMCAYDDQTGWQNRPFYGAAEFALDFGDYEVEITAPSNQVVAATGTLLNAGEVLEKEQMKRWEKMMKTEGEVQFIITKEEAEKNEKSKAKGMKTWKFKAENVRDFAFAASKKFVWDAGRVEVGGKMVTAQSLYPKEGMPLWDAYATHVVMHTLKTYSKYSLDYPYPQATAIHGAVWGMEYPMICFCGGRPSRTGFYSRTTKYRMIGVIIHEVGHNFFPMIVNSDERRWAWMDEGLNSFLEYLTEREFEPDFPHRRGPADDFSLTMFLSDHDPIMTNPESIRNNGAISYNKVATGLVMLRELILGPEAFDYAFRSYSNRWKFKRPHPADFFRSMEDASGQDLDWFWRGWFYGEELVDFEISEVKHYFFPRTEDFQKASNTYPSHEVERTDNFYIEGKPSLKDKYTGNVKAWDRTQSANEKAIAGMVADHKEREGNLFHIYSITIENKGGCVMPIVMETVDGEGNRENHRLPAQIWFKGAKDFTYEFRSEKEIVAFNLDGLRLLPDPDRSNNLYPQPKLKKVFEEIDWR